MGGNSEVDLFFGDGFHTFGLKIAQAEELESKRLRVLAGLGFPAHEASLDQVAARLRAGGSLIDDVREVLRLGLIGGGMDKRAAFDLVERHYQPGEHARCATLAWAVVRIWLEGTPGDKPGDDLDGDPPGAPPSGEPGPAPAPTARTSARPRKTRPAARTG